MQQKAVRQGRSFLRWLIDLSTVAKQLDHFIRLNQAARSDIRWWYEFVESWNGTSMIIQAKKYNPDLVMTSDASGSWGCGAFFGKQWFMLQWPAGMESTHITTKELIPIVIGQKRSSFVSPTAGKTTHSGHLALIAQNQHLISNLAWSQLAEDRS